MCGIAGLWSNTLGDPGPVVAAMASTLHHRGPDSRGLWRSPDGDLALGHARLAIVDLSEQGHQPMTSRSGRYTLVFNGEIYNHPEMRRELGPGIDWRGHSDTETLLESIERYGIRGALERAVGMFAIALWDQRGGSLSLVRDRLGEKPLYWAWGRHGLAFASEIKALRRCPGVDLSTDDEALRSFVQYGYIGGAKSAYLGIRKLEPACIMVSSTAAAPPEPATRYWHAPQPAVHSAEVTQSVGNDEDRVSELDQLLQTSVRQQMLSDVPLGAFLSGGIDSSLIVSLMQRNGSRPVETFTMGFDGGGEDELLAAREVALVMGTRHNELRVTPEDVLQTVPRMSAIYDEPFADSSQVPTALLSRLTHRHVTVALSGDGGDELFGGYNRYRFAERVDSWFGAWPPVLRRALSDLLLALPSGAMDGAGTRLKRLGFRNMPPAMGEKVARLAQLLAAQSSADAYLSVLSQWTIDGASPLLQSAPKPVLQAPSGVSIPQQMMGWDLHGYLPDDILVKVDRAAMASSLETRVPLLDHRIVEFAMRTPLHQKIRNGRTKWLLRELLTRHLPGISFERPKQGFTVPLGDWLRGPLRGWAEDLLTEESLRRSGLLDVRRVRQTWEAHLNGLRNHQRGLWTVLMLQDWLHQEKSFTPGQVEA